MNYVISDIHGCYKEFKALLKKIKFSPADTLFVLGDMVDRGADPIGVLKLMASYPNIYPLAGNHEFIMMSILPKLMQEISEDNIESTITEEFLHKYNLWIEDGGAITVNGFKKLLKEEQEFLLDYLDNMSVYEKIRVNNQNYILVHSLPSDLQNKKNLNYQIEEVLFGRPDFTASWNQEDIYIIGHTPTFKIPGAVPGKIYRRNNLIDIDCGCVTGHALCAYCIDTGEAFYEPVLI